MCLSTYFFCVNTHFSLVAVWGQLFIIFAPIQTNELFSSKNNILWITELFTSSQTQ